MKIFKILLDDFLVLTVLPELIYRIIKSEFCEDCGNLSKYATWVTNFID